LLERRPGSLASRMTVARRRPYHHLRSSARRRPDFTHGGGATDRGETAALWSTRATTATGNSLRAAAGCDYWSRKVARVALTSACAVCGSLQRQSTPSPNGVVAALMSWTSAVRVSRLGALGVALQSPTLVERGSSRDVRVCGVRPSQLRILRVGCRNRFPIASAACTSDADAYTSSVVDRRRCPRTRWTPIGLAPFASISVAAL
jgi:hypothetical protein